MGAAPQRKPVLQVIREGNPGKRPLPDAVVLPPAELTEPDWKEAFPAQYDLDRQHVNKRCREIASREWNRVVPVLSKAVGLSAVDAQLLQDYCITVARIDQCEREISFRGMLVEGERGWQKNGATTIAGQYRSQLRVYIRELGLSPSARTGWKAPGGDDDGDPFD